jgi:hypothetical protein
MRTVTLDDVHEYRISGYRAFFPLGLRHIAPVMNPANLVPVAKPTPADLFSRGIKKSKDDYLEYTNEKNFDTFRRNVEATASTHGTARVLDVNFQPDPNDLDDVALFKVQQDYMFTVFDLKMKTDKSLA